jgi:2-aminoethylphosphonate dioxygenase
MAATISTPRGLSRSDVRAYHDQGFVVVRGLFTSEEMRTVADEADRLLGLTELIDTRNIRCRWQPHVETGECLFETFDPVADLSPICDTLARDERLLATVADLYGERGHLFKEKLIWKLPGARGYDLHQDYIGWPGFPKSFLTALIAIDATNVENGGTEMFPGYHKNGYHAPEDGKYHPMPADMVDESLGIVLELAPGDVALFGAFTPHRSAPNRTNSPRRAFYVSYNADSDGGEQHDRHYAEFHAWLRQRYDEYGKTDVYFR